MKIKIIDRIGDKIEKMHSHLTSPGLLKGAIFFIMVLGFLSFLPDDFDLDGVRVSNAGKGGSLGLIVCYLYQYPLAKIILHIIPIWLIMAFLIRNRNRQ